jgi:hypothetical protein
VQCEDLYELISCLLPEVTASPAQHCTYLIFGTKLSWVRPALFAVLSTFNLLFALFDESRASKMQVAGDFCKAWWVRYFDLSSVRTKSVGHRSRDRNGQ